MSDGAMILLSWLILTALAAGATLEEATPAEANPTFANPLEADVLGPDYDISDWNHDAMYDTGAIHLDGNPLRVNTDDKSADLDRRRKLNVEHVATDYNSMEANETGTNETGTNETRANTTAGHPTTANFMRANETRVDPTAGHPTGANITLADAWGANVPEASPAGNQSDPGCVLIPADLLHYYCGPQEFKVQNQVLMEVICAKAPLDCYHLPPSRRPPRRLSRLEVNHCALPTALSLTCVAGASDVLVLERAVGTLTVDNVRGVDAEELFINCEPGKVSELPMEAISALPRLKRLRLLAGTSVRVSRFPPSPLQYLEVSMSGVTDLPAGALADLKNLTTLSLFLNNIEHIDLDQFIGLESLQSVDLSNNPLRTLRGGERGGELPLRTLYLEGVALRTLRAPVLGGLVNLQQLNISSSEPLSLEGGAFSALRSLRALSVRDTRLAPLPHDLLTHNTLLLNLTLTNNNLDSIPERLLSQLTSLRLLDLSNNKLRVLPERVFSDLLAVIRVDLTRNLLTAVPPMLFSGLTKLQSVSLAHNQLSEVSPLSFVGASSLVYLSLSHNKLSWAPQPLDYNDEWSILGETSPLNMLVNLESLDLSHNNISVIYSDWRYVMRSLTTLDLSYNSLTELSQADMNFLGSGSHPPTLVVSHNRITSVQPRLPLALVSSTASARVIIDNNPFHCDCVLYDFVTVVQSGTSQYSAAGARCATGRGLVGAPLSALPTASLTCPLREAGACHCLIRAKYSRVECDCDHVGQVPDIHATGLTEMSLRLHERAHDLRHLPPAVNNLTLTHVNLTAAPEVPPTVKHIDLSNNLIQTIPEELLERNLTLTLSNNPIACDCFSKQNVILLQKYYFKIDYDDVTCADGSLVKQKDVAGLCDVYRSYVTGSLTAVTVILLAIIVSLGYLYRVEVQVLLYRRRWCLFLLPKEEEEQDKKYDVFVSFAHEDEKFVLNEILPKLSNYVLHVQGRDWEVGGTIPSQIHRSVEESRRTLIILSTNFINSRWSTEEFRTVHAQATSDKKTRAIVILVDINKKQLEIDTKTFLSLCTFIKFNEVMFWDKLKFALPRHNTSVGNAELCDVSTTVRKGGVGKAAFNNKERVLDLWRAGGLDVVKNDEGKLVNLAFVKDV